MCIVPMWLCSIEFAAFLVFFIIVSVTVMGELDFNSMKNHIPIYENDSEQGQSISYF